MNAIADREVLPRVGTTCADCEHCAGTCWLGRALCYFDPEHPEWTNPEQALVCDDFERKGSR